MRERKELTRVGKKREIVNLQPKKKRNEAQKSRREDCYMFSKEIRIERIRTVRTTGRTVNLLLFRVNTCPWAQFSRYPIAVL